MKAEVSTEAEMGRVKGIESLLCSMVKPFPDIPTASISVLGQSADRNSVSVLDWSEAVPCDLSLVEKLTDQGARAASFDLAISHQMQDPVVQTNRSLGILCFLLPTSSFLTTFMIRTSARRTVML